MFLCCFYYFNVVLCLVMLVCNDILAITMFCILLYCFLQLQYCFYFLIFFCLLLVILKRYNIPILLYLVQFCIVPCYIIGCCFVFSNVVSYCYIVVFSCYNVIFVLVSRFVMLYYCFYCYNVVLCVILLFCIDTTLFYSLKYRIVSYYVNL